MRVSKVILQETKKRLKVYPILKRNVKNYKKDLEDIEREGFGVSQSVVRYEVTYREPPTIEEKRYIKKRYLQVKYEKDKAETEAIERSLLNVRHQKNFHQFTRCYMLQLERENKELRQMLNAVAVGLYGVDAFEKTIDKSMQKC